MVELCEVCVLALEVVRRRQWVWVSERVSEVRDAWLGEVVVGRLLASGCSRVLVVFQRSESPLWEAFYVVQEAKYRKQRTMWLRVEAREEAKTHARIRPSGYLKCDLLWNAMRLQLNPLALPNRQR